MGAYSNHCKWLSFFNGSLFMSLQGIEFFQWELIQVIASDWFFSVGAYWSLCKWLSFLVGAYSSLCKWLSFSSGSLLKSLQEIEFFQWELIEVFVSGWFFFLLLFCFPPLLIISFPFSSPSSASFFASSSLKLCVSVLITVVVSETGNSPDTTAEGSETESELKPPTQVDDAATDGGKADKKALSFTIAACDLKFCLLTCLPYLVSDPPSPLVTVQWGWGCMCACSCRYVCMKNTML